MTIDQLLKMPVGERIGGGFVLTVKKTKKSVQLPNKTWIFTVILIDGTGEMLADFKCPLYSPLMKNAEVAIIVAEIQKAEEETKLFVHQFEIPKGKSEPDYWNMGVDNSIPDWETITKGKIRHGIVCSLIKSNVLIPDILDVGYKPLIEKLVEYVFTGE